MSTDVDIALTVNGERVARRVEARRHLVDFLRLDLGLMGSHTGCEHGVCGACTVRVDGRIVRGCLVLAASLDGAEVETIEGVRTRPARSATCRRRSVARNACQCGYCTPAMLYRRRFAGHNPQPTRAESASTSPATTVAAPAITPSSMPSKRSPSGAVKGRGMNEIMRPPGPSTGPTPTSARSRCRGPMPKKLVEGRGQYVDDMLLPRMVHVAFVRSPHAHAKIAKIDGAEALEVAGRAARIHGGGPGPALRPVGRHPGAPEGHEISAAASLPLERRPGQASAVAAVVAESRGIAEDAVAKVHVAYEPLPAAVDMETALEAATP